MEAIKLSAEVRAGRGKGPARRLRASGQLPAVLYGPGIEPTPLTVSPKELLKALQSDRGRNTLLDITFDGRTEHALVRDVTVHPVNRTLVHVDLYRVDVNAPVDFQVTFSTRGRALGVQKGGKMATPFRELPVRCTPDKVPARIELDVTTLDLGSVITAADIELPEGVVITLKPTQTIVSVFEERAALVDPDAPVAGAPAGKGGKGAPAAKAAPAAAKAPAKK
jgi:large subunit ribosomal protein L25